MLSTACLLSLGLSAIGGPIGAHSELEASSPGVGELVTEPVETVELDFASNVVADSATVAVVVDAVEVPASIAGGSASDILNVTLEDAVRSGPVGVAVRVVAADGHQIEVGVEFDVAAPPPTTTTETSAPSGPPTSPPVSEVPTTTEPAPTSTPAPTAEPAIDDLSSADGAADAALEAIDSAGLERWDDLQTGLRPIAYVLTIALVGAAAFGWFVRTAGPTRIEHSWLRWSGLGLIAATLLWLAFQSAIIGDAEAAAMLEPSAWSDALVGSVRAGFWLRLLGAVVCVVSTWLAGRSARVLALGGVGLVALSFGFLGHSATASPEWLAVASSGIHVAAVGVWIGGLFMLLLAIHQDRDAGDQLIRRFSRVAAWSLVPVIAAGIALAIIRLDSFGDLFDTSYGRLLIAKVLVVIAILALGTRNNAEVRRRTVGLAALVARYGRVELILAALVLLLTTILVAAA